jgi:hypothetical protein
LILKDDGAAADSGMGFERATAASARVLKAYFIVFGRSEKDQV